MDKVQLVPEPVIWNYLLLKSEGFGNGKCLNSYLYKNMGEEIYSFHNLLEVVLFLINPSVYFG